MRFRIALVGSLALLATALAMPATVSAAEWYSYRIVENYCAGDDPNMTIKMIKPAGRYPDKFTMDARGQHRNLGSTRWSNESSNARFRAWVPYQYAKWTWSKPIYWDAPDGAWHRIKVKMRVWIGGSVVASKTVYSVAC